MTEKIRLGGMALANGVLVHGPTAWACAVRTDDGELKVVARRKRLQASQVRNPILRGPARIAEALGLLPQVKRALPEAQLPMQSRGVLAAMLGSAVVLQAIRRTTLRPVTRELLAGALSLAPAAFALRGGELAEYHGAEHISIGTYEHGEARPKEHERCGSHLVGPLILASAAGAGLAARVPGRMRKPASLFASLGAFAAATETFCWMVRHPDNPVAKALAWPGTELQSRVATAEPSPEQVEVAQAALNACLERERAAVSAA